MVYTRSGLVAPLSPLRRVAMSMDPISLWRLGEASGNAADEMGANTGTYTGSSITRNVAGGLIADSDGAVTLPGLNGSYVLAKAGGIISGKRNWSVVVLLNHNGHPANDKAIYCERGASGNDILKVQLTASGPGGLVQLVYRDDAGTTDFAALSAADVTDAQFHLIGMTKIGVTAQCYVDGVASGSPGTLTASDTFTNTLSARWGGDAQDGNAYIGGTLDEGMLFGYGLSPAQMLSLFHATGR